MARNYGIRAKPIEIVEHKTLRSHLLADLRWSWTDFVCRVKTFLRFKVR